MLVALTLPLSLSLTCGDQVALTCTVDVIDLLGIYVCLTRFTARYENSAIKIKVLSTVVGEPVHGRRYSVIVLERVCQ